jgi:hypothetical protein
MKRLTLVALFVTILLSLNAWTAYTQTAKPPGRLSITKVKGDLYEITGEGGFRVAITIPFRPFAPENDEPDQGPE